MCGGRRQFFTEVSPGQDFVQARFFEPGSAFVNYQVTAASGPAGQNADGQAYRFTRAFMTAQARVTCLKVETVNYTVRAAIGVVGTMGNPPQPYSALYTISKTLFEPNRRQVREQSPPDCEHADFGDLVDGDVFELTIRDVP